VGAVAIIQPDLWARLFTTDPEVKQVAHLYLSIAGWGFAPMGFGLAIYFASQGSGRMFGPVLAGTVRLVAVAAGGYLLSLQGAPASTLFGLVAVAMLAYGFAMAVGLFLTRWQQA